LSVMRFSSSSPAGVAGPYLRRCRPKLRFPSGLRGYSLCDRNQGAASHRQFRGSTQWPHRRVLERRRMDQAQRSNPRPPIRDWSTMTSSPTSASARQLARNKGLAWVSAITLGAGAASALGAAAIAVSLPSPTTATSASSGALTASASANTSEDDSGSTLQAAPAPATSNIPPVATTGAS